VRFAHTNLVAQDWRALADFYSQVFGCSLRPPERRLSGTWLETGTGVPGAALEGVHLLLPGHGDGGPTLEIFTYSRTLDAGIVPANRRGLGHLAFEVEDVARTAQSLLEHGGSLDGQITERHVEGAGTITFVYARDPEGNVIELQSWRR